VALIQRECMTPSAPMSDSFTICRGISPDTRMNNKCSAVAEMGDRLATIDMGRKLGAVTLFGGTWISIQHNVAGAEACLRTKWHLNPSSRLTTTDMGRKSGAVPLFWGRLGPHLTQILHNVAGAEVYLHAKFHLDPSNRLATIHQRHRQTEQDRQTYRTTVR